MSKRARGKQPQKKMKSFAELHGSKSDMFNKVTPQQLGHDPQIPVSGAKDSMLNKGSSPLANPGQPGHYMADPGRIGEAMGYDPSGSEFY